MSDRVVILRKKLFTAAGIGFIAVVANRFLPHQGLTVAESVLFGGGAIVGVRSEAPVRTLWLACAIPWTATIALDLSEPNTRTLENPELIPAALVGMAASWAAITSFFAAGCVAGRRVKTATLRRHELLSEIGLPTLMGIITSLAILALSRSIGGKSAVDGPWPLSLVIASCLAWGATATRAGRHETAFSRVVGVAVGNIIGLTAWMSFPELSNLAHLFLVVLAIATSGCVAAGAKIASISRSR